MLSADKKAQLTWRARRGMLELDLIFERFLARDVEKLSDEQVQLFDLLLTQPDPDIYAWLMGYDIPTDAGCAQIVNFIRLHDYV